MDPLAEKYRSISSYAYVANNPIIYFDPDGREIWIADGTYRVKYIPNMAYKGYNLFVATTIGLLNHVNEVSGGTKVLSYLTASNNQFDFTNSQSSGGERTFQFDIKDQKYAKGGAQIRASEILNTNLESIQKVESIAHELFHGLQRENNRNPATINAEVEAYLFGRGIGISSYPNSGFLSFGNLSNEGELYNQAMFNLMFGTGDINQNFNVAIENFLKGSSSGHKYPRHQIDPNYDPLLFQFLPLID